MIAERILMGLLIGVVAVGCVAVLYPFFSALLWAAILVFTTWPVHEWIRARLRLKRTASALIMVALTAVVLVLPIGLAAPGGSDDVTNLRHVILDALRAGLPVAPDWLRDMPLIGPSVAELWDHWAADIGALLEALRPFLGIILEGGLSVVLGIANGVVMFLLALFVAFFFYVYGEPIAERLRLVLRRVAGDQAERLAEVTGATVRGVVYGIVGTAVVQGILTSFGLWLSGVPRPLLLGGVAGVLSVLPIGAPVVWIPAALVASGHRPYRLGDLPGGLRRRRGVRRRQRHPAVVHRPRRALAVPADHSGCVGRRAGLRAAGDFPRSGASGRRLHPDERMGEGRGARGAAARVTKHPRMDGFNNAGNQLLMR